MLGNELSSYNSLALRALDPDHLASLLMRHYVASRTFHSTVGRSVAGNALHLSTIDRIVLQYVPLQELLVAEEALQARLTATLPIGGAIIFYKLVLGSPLDVAKLLNLFRVQTILGVQIILNFVLVVQLLEGTLRA